MTALSNAVVADLARRFEEGEFEAGDLGPEFVAQLAAEYDVDTATIVAALRTLGVEFPGLRSGLVRPLADIPTLEDLQRRRDALARAIEVIHNSAAAGDGP